MSIFTIYIGLIVIFSENSVIFSEIFLKIL
nr:MAG TPA: hypothetical protein [Caudoviricetes sp.]